MRPPPEVQMKGQGQDTGCAAVRLTKVARAHVSQAQLCHPIFSRRTDLQVPTDE